MFPNRLAEYLAVDQPVLFGNDAAIELLTEFAIRFPPLLKLARSQGSSPPAYFHALDQLCEPIFELHGPQFISDHYGVPLKTAKAELKNTLNFACWIVFDELQAQP